MSFSRAPLKRFNEVVNCVPSPTKYNVTYPYEKKYNIPPATVRAKRYPWRHPNHSRWGPKTSHSLSRALSVPNVNAMGRRRLRRSISSGNIQDVSSENTSSLTPPSSLHSLTPLYFPFTSTPLSSMEYMPPDCIHGKIGFNWIYYGCNKCETVTVFM